MDAWDKRMVAKCAVFVVATVASLFALAALHEVSHVAAMRAFGSTDTWIDWNWSGSLTAHGTILGASDSEWAVVWMAGYLSAIVAAAVLLAVRGRARAWGGIVLYSVLVACAVILVGGLVADQAVGWSDTRTLWHACPAGALAFVGAMLVAAAAALLNVIRWMRDKFLNPFWPRPASSSASSAGTP